MGKYKIILNRKECIGAFSCVPVGDGEDIWEMNEPDGKVDLKIEGAKCTEDHHEVEIDDEELAKKAITSGEVCPVYAIKVIETATGKDLVTDTHPDALNKAASSGEDKKEEPRI